MNSFFETGVFHDRIRISVQKGKELFHVEKETKYNDKYGQLH